MRCSGDHAKQEGLQTRKRSSHGHAPKIAALPSWKTSAEFDAKEKAALLLAEAVTQGKVSDEVYAEAMRHFDHHDYVELSLVAAFYAMVARMLDAMGVQLEPEMRHYAPKLP